MKSSENWSRLSTSHRQGSTGLGISRIERPTRLMNTSSPSSPEILRQTNRLSVRLGNDYRGLHVRAPDFGQLSSVFYQLPDTRAIRLAARNLGHHRAGSAPFGLAWVSDDQPGDAAVLTLGTAFRWDGAGIWADPPNIPGQVCGGPTRTPLIRAVPRRNASSDPVFGLPESPAAAISGYTISPTDRRIA